jgi:hypothetical protein
VSSCSQRNDHFAYPAITSELHVNTAARRVLKTNGSAAAAYFEPVRIKLGLSTSRLK